ncbi:Proteophosphoglycan ppg4 [Rhodotorula toruloides ATCC 204091]|uniref:Proteophosphoglycan ppg4 n=1 Tax=Rhodotorula toruloides TaxID=5286 RepID=A0A0K3CFC1_RHOTO|nr:Proteophosphoglycan ppg4 [Rhodotorula toruloides ATCC 204091]PRQ74180.1 Proteophosphoglycan ppg4 [Rhodotorula toruloides]
MPKRSRPSGPHDTPTSSSARGGARGQNTETRALQGGTGSRKLKFKDAQRPPKRTRTAVLPLLSLEGSLSEEILLRCLSFLGAQDLAVVARVSSAWYRLSQDPQLWRDLYLRTYASAATRRQALYGGGIERNRPWRELYKVSTNWRSGTARASTLGKSIRKAVLPEAPPVDLAELSSDGGEPVAGPSVRRPAHLPPIRLSSSRQDVDTILQFHQHYILSASRLPAGNPSTAPPSVTVHQTLPSGGSAVVGSFSSTRLADFFADRPGFRPPLAITDVRLDEAHGRSDPILCAVFYSTGQWSLFRLAFPGSTTPSRPFEAEEIYASLAIASPPSHPLSAAPAPSPTSSPFDPVSLARLHSPLLVTLSDSLTLRFMRLDEAEDGKIEVDEAETPLQSREDWAPVVLDVSQESSDPEEDGVWLGKKREEQQFKVSLAYSMSVFPASWTVGIQEFTIDVPPSRRAALSTVRVLPKMRISARHATAAPIHSPLPSTPRRSAPLAPPSPPSTPTPPPTSRSPVTSIEHSHPFIVTSRVDNTLDVYEIVSRPTPSLTSTLTSATHSRPSTSRIRLNLHPSSATDPLSPLSPPLRIIHRRTLFGHTARVASVALLPEPGAGEADEAGVKCVSAGDDGVVKVWHLSPSKAKGKEGRKRRKREGEEVVDVRAVSTADQRQEDERTDWQRLRQKRGREEERPQKVKRVRVDEDKIVVVGAGADSSSTASSDPASPASSSHSEGSNSRKQVCFHPLALCISTAPDGEIEKAMAQAAKEELAQRRRMLGIKTYCIEAPALSDMTSSAWHSVVNGFTSSLGPYLTSPSSSRARDDSPDRQTGRRGSGSISPSTTRARQEDDPTFIPNPPTRLTVKLPALKRSCSSSCATSACKSILRKKPERGCSLPPIDDEPEASTSSQRLPHFPPLSPTTSPAPTLARSAPLAIPDRPNRRRSSSLPATVSPDATLIPLLPCCATCERATLYGCSPPSSSLDSYTEQWSAGALKKREDEKRAEEEREKYRAEADRIRKSYVVGSRCGTRRVGFEREWREKEEEWATNHLGELVERQGGVDELDRVKKREGRERRASHEEKDEKGGTADEEHEEEERSGGQRTAGSLSRATTIVAEPAKYHDDKVEVKMTTTASPTSPLPTPQQPPSPSNASSAAQLSQPTPPPAAASPSTTTAAPTPASPRPPPVRRLSSAAASFSQRLASAVGSGLTHVPVSAPGVRTGF